MTVLVDVEPPLTRPKMRADKQVQDQESWLNEQSMDVGNRRKRVVQVLRMGRDVELLEMVCFRDFEW
jgi:hypothetical protein